MNQPTSATSATQEPSAQAVSLSPRALINIGVFTAIYFVIVFASGMLGFFSPAMQVVGFLIGMLINGTVIMLFMVKVRSMGAMTVLGFLVGLLMVLTGHFWATVLLTTVFGFLADLLVRSGGYRSRVRNMFAYGLFQMWVIGPFLPVFYDTAGYRAYIAKSMGADYADAMMRLFSPAMLIGLLALSFVVSVFAAWIGTRILDRNLSRAGVL